MLILYFKLLLNDIISAKETKSHIPEMAIYLYCLMIPVQSREEQHSVSPGSLQISLGSSPTHCSGAWRCFVLKHNLVCSVFLHSKSSPVSLDQDRPLHVDEIS